MESPRVSGKSHFPVLLWVIFKALCLFDSNPVVGGRKCFKCRLAELRRKRRKREFESSLEVVVPTCIKSDSDRIQESDSDEETTPLLSPTNTSIQEGACDVCDTLWWDAYGQIQRYTETEIGVKPWNHQGSNLLSSIILLVLLASNFYDWQRHVLAMWSDYTKILHSLGALCLVVLNSSIPVAVLVSKLQRTLGRNEECLIFAKTWNVGYLIRRMQLLELTNKGLPGKPYLFWCFFWPLVNSVYRAVLLFCFTGCFTDVHLIATSVNAIILLPMWGMYVYVIFLIRLSFERQFSLLVFYIQENQGEIDRCRDAIKIAFADFYVFRRFCKGYTILMFPVLVLAFSIKVTWQVLLGNSFQYEYPGAKQIQKQVKCVDLSMMVMGVILLMCAQGGFDVHHPRQRFRKALSHMESSSHPRFWKEVNRSVKTVLESTYVMLLTLTFSVVGVFTAINLKDQNPTYWYSTCEHAKQMSNATL